MEATTAVTGRAAASSALLERPSQEELEMRSRILSFEDQLRELDHWEGDTDHCPLTHEFPPGLYVRTIRIPGGTVCTGKLHRHSHPNILQKGVVEVATEHGGIERLEGPLFMISKGLTKRALVAITDLVWTTIHPNPKNLKDPAEIEKDVIIEDLTQYQKEICHTSQLEQQ